MYHIAVQQNQSQDAEEGCPLEIGDQQQSRTVLLLGERRERELLGLGTAGRPLIGRDCKVHCYKDKQAEAFPYKLSLCHSATHFSLYNSCET